MLHNNAVLRVGGQPLAHEAFEGAPIKGARVPFTRVIGLDRRDIQASIHTRDGAVAEKGQRFSSCGQVIGW